MAAREKQVITRVQWHRSTLHSPLRALRPYSSIQVQIIMPGIMYSKCIGMKEKGLLFKPTIVTYCETREMKTKLDQYVIFRSFRGDLYFK